MLALPSALVIHTIGELHEQLTNLLDEENGNQIVLDGQDLQDIDASGIQMLVALQKTCTVLNKELKIIGIPESIGRLLRISGADFILGNGRA